MSDQGSQCCKDTDDVKGESPTLKSREARVIKRR